MADNTEDLLKDFSEFLLNYYDIISDQDFTYWKLCGTNQIYTSEQVIERFLESSNS